jgi:hypothetical protein
VDDGLTRDEALFVLNEHCGQPVELLVRMIDDENTLAAFHSKSKVVVAYGYLQHWADEDVDREYQSSPVGRFDIAGLYVIGDARFNVTDHGEPVLLVDGKALDYGIAFRLSDTIVLSVVWRSEILEDFDEVLGPPGGPSNNRD